MDPEAFRAAAHDVVDRIADYLATIEALPGAARGGARVDRARSSRRIAPERPEPLDAILADVDRLVVPNATHWQHPGFFAYFATTASGPGMLGEFLTAALGQNPMLWRTSPIGTELETVVVGWLREALGLPDDVRRAADRYRVDVDADRACGGARGGGLDAAARRAGCPGEGRPSRGVYAARRGPQLDREGVHDARARAGRPSSRSRSTTTTRWTSRRSRWRSPTDRPPAAARSPIVATIGTTSSTSVDPVAAIADVAAREGLWLHVDAAYAGPVAILPERRAAVRRLGARRLDRRQPAQVAVHAARRIAAADPADGPAARGVQPRARVPADARPGDARPRLQRVPAAARPADAGAQAVDAAALVRAGGAAAADRVPPGARRSSSPAWVDADPDWERLAPVPFSTVCFRYRPRRAGRPRGRGRRPRPARRPQRAPDGLPSTARGEVFLSHTRLRDRFTIRLAIGNLRTEQRHVERAWALLRREAAAPRRRDHTREPRMSERDRDPVLLPDAVGRARRVRRRCSGATTGRSCASSWPRAGSRPSSCGRRASTARAARTGTCWSRSRTATGRRSQEHSDAEIAARLYPDQDTFKARGAPSVRAPRRALGRGARGAPARPLADAIRDTGGLTHPTPEAVTSPCRPSPS